MSNKMLEELRSIAGWSAADISQVTISGHDPVLPTRFMLGEAAAGAHAACGLAAAKLWEIRTRRQQQVSVEVIEAAATIQSFMYLQLLDVPPAEAAAGFFGGFYTTRDNRWFYLHPGTDPMKVLTLLGCQPTSESCAAVIRMRDSSELEDTFAEQGLNGAIARTAQEWATHPQGQILSTLPVVEIIKIGDSAPEPLPHGNRPLSGIRCLDLTRILAGPTCSRTLAEHGADVLWVGAEHLPDIPQFYIDTSHGKRSTFLDLRESANRDKLWELTEQADVFCQAYRLGAVSGRGYSIEEVAARRPGIVYVFENCYGPVGPWAGRRGWEQLAQTVTGLAIEEGKLPPPPVNDEAAKLAGVLYGSWHTPMGVPRIVPGAITDYVTGYLLAFGTMVALRRRALEGGSYVVRSSLAQTGMCVERMGQVDAEKAMAQSELVAREVREKLTLDEKTAYGRMRYLGPIIRMSETPPRWSQPTVPRGSLQPVWLDR
jgi:crotonobetainyl-CoA:carnitine CoA-transferase CaiB-like acyl-CoA transferase